MTFANSRHSSSDQYLNKHVLNSTASVVDLHFIHKRGFKMSAVGLKMKKNQRSELSVDSYLAHQQHFRLHDSPMIQSLQSFDNH